MEALLSSNHPIRSSDWRRIYILQHPLLVTISVMMLAMGLLVTLSPPLFASTVIAKALPSGLEYPWDLCLLLGSSMMLAGIFRLSARLEATGSVLLSTALIVWVFVYLTAQVADQGTISIVVAPGLAVGVALGLAIRAFVIVTTSTESQPWLSRTRSSS